MLQLPSARTRLVAFVIVIQIEPQARELQRQLDKVIEGAQQMRASSALELALAHVLGIGNAMNERTARGDAGGFGLEVLSSLMGVKAASGHSTMMHYLAEVLAQHGVSAAAVRSELRRAADAASIDLGDVTLFEVVGSLDVTAPSGRVEGTALSSPTADIRGDRQGLQLIFDTQPDILELSTGRGAIDVGLPRGDYDIDASSTQGDVRVSDVTNTPGAGSVLIARSARGDIVIRGN